MNENDGAGVEKQLDVISKITGEIGLISDYREKVRLFNNTCWTTFLGRTSGSFRALMFRLDGTYGILEPQEYYPYTIYMSNFPIEKERFTQHYEYKNHVLSFDICERWVFDG